MTITMPTAAVEGIQLIVTPFRPDAVIGTVGLPALLQLVPSPKTEEDKRALKYASGSLRRHAEVRALVQRMLKSTQKGRNVTSYAAYIAAAVNGEYGSGWSTPPITLWLDGRPGAISDELVPGSGIRTITVLPASPVVAIDGETQVAAWHELFDDPERFGISYEKLSAIRIPFELYFGLSVEDARQIFYDRNVEGVPVAKNLAMSMDQRDIGTRLAHRVAEMVKVEHDGKIIPFAKLVQARKRQLTKTDPEVVTLSALRLLVVTALYGRSGLGQSSATVHEGDLPNGISVEQVKRELAPLLSQVITRLYPHFAARDAVSAPAVLAGLGVVAHQATSWAAGGARLNADDLLELLEPVRWEREARYWDGVAASANASGTLNFGGGAKDSGGRVADALLHPDTEYGRKIRGW
ncbi:DNA sulfur modification protein DndB [Actinorugispora endophytica]|uniref:DndB-like DNA-sulfur modification-associated protein n=1 Tax=Actinorugispora endophytica TaxID=1605990 RepID=A0A4R6UXP5_9ACTN|nr:DNA sulfur modification protein DndB [Actinorugispora endophytica]TDQ52237.1 DndB-like DNA-sulfur modification-associated protein [Actinorugispora endophytica]